MKIVMKLYALLCLVALLAYGETRCMDAASIQRKIKELTELRDKQPVAGKKAVFQKQIAQLEAALKRLKPTVPTRVVEEVEEEEEIEQPTRPSVNRDAEIKGLVKDVTGLLKQIRASSDDIAEQFMDALAQ